MIYAGIQKFVAFIMSVHIAEVPPGRAPPVRERAAWGRETTLRRLCQRGPLSSLAICRACSELSPEETAGVDWIRGQQRQEKILGTWEYQQE